MKVSEKITNYSQDVIEEDSLKKTLRVVKNDLIDSEYTRRFAAEDLNANTGVRMLLGNRASCPVLSDGISSFVTVNFPRPLSWTDGIMGWKWTLVGSVGSANPIMVQDVCDTMASTNVWHPAGGGVTVHTAYGVSAYAITGPATAYTSITLESNTVGYVTIDKVGDEITIRLVRIGGDAGDTYAGDLFPVSLEVRYFPSRSQN